MPISEPSLISASPKDFDAQIADLATYYLVVAKNVLLQLRQNEGLIILLREENATDQYRGQNLSADLACTIALLDRSSQQAATPA